MANNIRPYGDASLYDVYLNERKVEHFFYFMKLIFWKFLGIFTSNK